MYVLNIDIGYCKGYIKIKIYFLCSGMYIRYWSKFDKKNRYIWYIIYIENKIYI